MIYNLKNEHIKTLEITFSFINFRRVNSKYGLLLYEEGCTHQEFLYLVKLDSFFDINLKGYDCLKLIDYDSLYSKYSILITGANETGLIVSNRDTPDELPNGNVVSYDDIFNGTFNLNAKIDLKCYEKIITFLLVKISDFDGEELSYDTITDILGIN